jgi:hypothetical protein
MQLRCCTYIISRCGEKVNAFASNMVIGLLRLQASATDSRACLHGGQLSVGRNGVSESPRCAVRESGLLHAQRISFGRALGWKAQTATRFRSGGRCTFRVICLVPWTSTLST